jgi:hypothetical protein
MQAISAIRFIVPQKNAVNGAGMARLPFSTNFLGTRFQQLISTERSAVFALIPRPYKLAHAKDH